MWPDCSIVNLTLLGGPVWAGPLAVGYGFPPEDELCLFLSLPEVMRSLPDLGERTRSGWHSCPVVVVGRHTALNVAPNKHGLSYYLWPIDQEWRTYTGTLQAILSF